MEFSFDKEIFQNSAIEFCKDTLSIQKINSVYDLKLDLQLKFNTCIETVLDKINKDIMKIESFKNECNEKCINNNCLEQCEYNSKVIFNTYKNYIVQKKSNYFEF